MLYLLNIVIAYVIYWKQSHYGLCLSLDTDSWYTGNGYEKWLLIVLMMTQSYRINFRRYLGQT